MLKKVLYNYAFIFPKTNNKFVAKMYSSKQENLVLTEKLGHVCMIAINRPEKRNCVNQATAAQLVEAVEKFEEDNDLWVAILHGKGGNFCAGYDLSELSGMEHVEAFPSAEELKGGRGPMGPSRRMIKKPMIAAVEGYAVAGGLELALMCDMRIVEESTIMGVFCRRFGVPLLDGGTVRLPQLIGHSRAMDLILTGRPVTGKEAFQMGLGNRLVPSGSALGEAMNIARSICAHPQECLRRDRLSAYYSCFDAKSTEDAFNFEWNNGKHVVQQESVKGVQRFVGRVLRGLWTGLVEVEDLTQETNLNYDRAQDSKLKRFLEHNTKEQCVFYEI